MARIINRTSPELVMEAKGNIRFVTIFGKCLFFNKYLSMAAGLSVKKYAHFINEGDFWAFFVDENNDGFQFHVDRTGAYRINSSGLLEMIKRSIKKNNGDRLLVRLSGAEHNGNKVFELHTKETLDEYTQRELEKFFKRKHIGTKKEPEPFVKVIEVTLQSQTA